MGKKQTEYFSSRWGLILSNEDCPLPFDAAFLIFLLINSNLRLISFSRLDVSFFMCFLISLSLLRLMIRSIITASSTLSIGANLLSLHADFENNTLFVIYSICALSLAPPMSSPCLRNIRISACLYRKVKICFSLSKGRISL